MLQLIYASAAVKPFSPDELKKLLDAARAKNASLGISGMLLYHAGSFLQALEGPDDAVNLLFKGIEKDPRHTNVRLLFRDGVETSEFQDWSMGFVDASKSAKTLKGFLDYNTEAKAVVLDKTRAKKTLKMFQEGAWRQLVEQ
jgi:Sensors of blue-light using FAD